MREPGFILTTTGGQGPLMAMSAAPGAKIPPVPAQPTAI